MTSRMISRREFSERSVLAMLGGVVVTLAGCGDSGYGPTSASPSSGAPTATPSAPPGSVEGTVSANHGHVAVITAARLGEGNAISLDITGNAGHPHQVELTMAELQSIASGSRVSKPSSTFRPESTLYPDVEMHSHFVTFN